MRETDDGKARALAEFPELKAIAPQLEIYAALLRRWQKTVNLIGHSTVAELWWRHFADSAQAWLSVAPDVASIGAPHVDLGSGAGFPGLICALLAEGRLATELIESDTRKAAFLREVSRETGAGVEVVKRRAEDYILNTRAPTVLTSRAFMPPEPQIDLIRLWLAEGTTAVFLTGEVIERPDLNVRVTPSRTGPGFVLVLRRRESERP